jgi:hypothetical protein
MGSLSCMLWQALHLRTRAGGRIVTQTCKCLQCAAPICLRPRQCPALYPDLPSYMHSQPPTKSIGLVNMPLKQISTQQCGMLIAVNTCNAIPLSLVDTVYSLITSRSGQPCVALGNAKRCAARHTKSWRPMCNQCRLMLCTTSASQDQLATT